MRDMFVICLLFLFFKDSSTVMLIEAPIAVSMVHTTGNPGDNAHRRQEDKNC